MLRVPEISRPARLPHLHGEAAAVTPLEVIGSTSAAASPAISQLSLRTADERGSGMKLR